MSNNDTASDATSFLKGTTLLIGLVVAVAAAMLIHALETRNRQAFIAAERDKIHETAENLREHLELTLVDYQLRARALATALELDSGIHQARFSRLGEKFMKPGGAILNLALIEGSVISMVHPFEENRHLVGRDLRTAEGQYSVVERVYRTGEVRVQGPVELLQGSLGLIVRMPVAFGDTMRGGARRSVAVVIDADAVFGILKDHVADMNGEGNVSRIALAASAPGGAVVGDAGVFDADPVIETVAVRGTDLKLGMTPAGGWGAGYVAPWSEYIGGIVVLFLMLRMFHEFRRQKLARDRAQRQLNFAIETLPDGFVLYDNEDRLVLCNDKIKEFYSETAEAMVPGARFEDILRFALRNGQVQEAVGREEEWLAERLRNHIRRSNTETQKLSDGRYLRVMERATPDGGRVGLRIDITDQLRTQKRAEKAEQRLRDAINAMPAGFWLIDEEGRVVMYNEEYCKLYEKSAPAVKEGVLARDVVEYALANGEYPDAVGREQEWLKELSQKFSSGDYAWEYQLQNGRWVRSYNRTTSDGGRVGIRIDVTELKQQQADLEASNARLRRALAERDMAQTRFDDVAALSRDWVWEMDADLRFSYLSESFERFLGGNPDALLGKTREEVFGDDPEVWNSADWKLLQTKLAARAPFHDFVYLSNAGRATEDNKWIRISGVPIHDSDGNFAGYRGIGSDISVLYESLRKARAASLAKTEFLHMMSHELRTPLTVVLGYNAFLARPDMLGSVKAFEAVAADGALTEDSARQHLENIKAEVARHAGKMQDSGNHLLNLINDMLDLAKIDAGKLKVERQEVRLQPVIASVVDQFANQAQRKSLDLSFAANGETVLADDMRLRQILINLVGNALKFTEAGHVTVRTEVRRDTVAIHVEDTGPGIPEDKQAAIFDQFTQVDGSATRAQGGTGLGLTISRRLVEMLGGTLTVDSTPGAGSTFTFTLPQARDGELSHNSDEADQAA